LYTPWVRETVPIVHPVVYVPGWGMGTSWYMYPGGYGGYTPPWVCSTLYTPGYTHPPAVLTVLAATCTWVSRCEEEKPWAQKGRIPWVEASLPG